MKKTILLILIGAVIGGGIVFMKMRSGGPATAAGEKPEEEKPGATRVSRDEKGNVVVAMNDETQGNIGLKVEKPAAAQWQPELKGYGQVLDPVPLAAILTELDSARAAWMASSNELARLKILAAQGNTSPRALQTAEAAAQHDELAVQSARDRLVLSWGKAVADRNDLPAFVQSLASQDTSLVRIDLSAGEAIKSPPGGARIVTVSGNSVDAEFLGAASGVDPQMQGRGFIFLAKNAGSPLLSGEAVTGFLKVPGDALDGVNIPRDAVVRTEGSGWVYVLNEGGEAFTRVPVPLDRPTEAGWFVAKVVTATNNVVIIGAQTLLSEELKASLSSD
jgi:hypothetical protein